MRNTVRYELRMIFKTALLISALLMTSCASLLMPRVETQFATLKAGQYKLDPAHASILFKVQHLGLSTYVGRFNEFDASLNFDPENISTATLNGIIEIDSLDINNKALTKDLLSSTWFDVAQFPQAEFSTQAVNPISDNEFEFVGNLNWHGVTKLVSLHVKFNGGAMNMLTGKYTLGFTATGTVLRSEFGMDAYIPIVGDRVDIEIYAEFQRS